MYPAACWSDQNPLVAGERPEEWAQHSNLLHVGANEDDRHSRNGGRGRSVDRADARMWLLAAHQPPDCRAGGPGVERVGDFASHPCLCVQLLDPRTDRPTLLRVRFGEEVSSRPR